MSAAAVAQRPSNSGPLASQRAHHASKRAPAHAASTGGPSAAPLAPVALGGGGPPLAVIDRWQFEELLQCMICFEQYRTPKMLKCGHTFCAECLEGYVSFTSLFLLNVFKNGCRFVIRSGLGVLRCSILIIFCLK